MATFTNQATLSYNGTVRNSNITTGEILEVLRITKTALETGYAADETVTYVISIVNSGNTAYTGLTVTDDLGGYEVNGTTVYPLAYTDGSARQFTNGVVQATPTVTAGPPLVFTGINVPAGGSTMLIYEANVTDFAPTPCGSAINNSVTATNPTLLTALTAENTLPILCAPNLTIAKTLTPTAVADNGQITYTFVIQNIGNEDADAADNVAVTDTFNPILSGLTVTLNGVPLAEGTGYTYNEATGEFATVAGQITVPAATFTQNPDTGIWVTEPGVATLTVTGTI